MEKQWKKGKEEIWVKNGFGSTKATAVLGYLRRMSLVVLKLQRYWGYDGYGGMKGYESYGGTKATRATAVLRLQWWYGSMNDYDSTAMMATMVIKDTEWYDGTNRYNRYDGKERYEWYAGTDGYGRLQRYDGTTGYDDDTTVQWLWRSHVHGTTESLVDKVRGTYGKSWIGMNRQHGDKKQHETKEEDEDELS